MPAKYHKDDNVLKDKFGSVIQDVSGDKVFAVIVKCGHCGTGFFVPIMFTKKCSDASAAVKWIKNNPRVKRDQKNVVLGVFEITDFEQLIIESINDHDPYLRGYSTKDSDDLLERRIIEEAFLKDLVKAGEDVENFSSIKFAGDYDSYNVLEGILAPRKQGKNYVYPGNLNKTTVLGEFFTEKIRKLGIKKSNPYFISLYYQAYGENNALGINYNGSYFTYYSHDGKIHSIEVPEQYVEKLENSGLLVPKKNEEFLIDETTTLDPHYAINKFNKRFEKFKKFQEGKNGGSNQSSQPGLE